MEVYIIDMVVKSLRSEDHLKNLEKAFRIVHAHKNDAQPSQVYIGILAGKFPSFIIIRRGNEICLNQIKALRDMPMPNDRP